MIIAMSTDYNGVFNDIIDEDPEELKGPLRRHYDLLKSYEAEGKYLGGYYLPGEDRSMLFFNFADEAEVDRFFLEDPMRNEFDYEVQVGVPALEHLVRVLSQINS